MKTKHPQRIQLCLDSKDLTNSRFLTYLVGLVTQMVILTKTKARLSKTSGAFINLKNICMSKRIRTPRYKAIKQLCPIRTVVLCGILGDEKARHQQMIFSTMDA